MFAILFYCASVNGGAGNIMHTKHKTQYKQNKILSQPNNKTPAQNQAIRANKEPQIIQQTAQTD